MGGNQMVTVTMVEGNVFYLGSLKIVKDVPVEVTQEQANYLQQTYGDKFVVSLEETPVEETPDTIGFEPIKPLTVTKDTFLGLAEKNHKEIDEVALQVGLHDYSKKNLTREEKVEEIKDYWFSNLEKK